MKMSANAIPVEIWEIIASHIGPFHKRTFTGYSDDKLPTRRARRDLQNLRATCRYFQAWTSPLLFQTIVITTPKFGDDKGWLKWFNRIEGLSSTNCTLTKHVRKLTIDIASRDEMSELAWLSQHASRLIDFVRLLPNVTDLSLEISMIKQYDRILGRICVALSMRRGPVKITHLTVSTSRDSSPMEWCRCRCVSPLNTSHLRRMIRDLQHIQVDNKTGWDVPCVTGTSHLNAAWGLLKYARKLTSFDFQIHGGGTWMDLKPFGAAGPENLQELSFYDVWPSAENLRALAARYCHSLRKISFWRVSLTSHVDGRWWHILLQLCQASHLTDFTILNCDYRNGDIRGNSLTDEERSQLLECQETMSRHRKIVSSDKNDYLALGHIQRHVNRVRVESELSPFGDNEYRYINHPPMLGQIG